MWSNPKPDAALLSVPSKAQMIRSNMLLLYTKQEIDEV